MVFHKFPTLNKGQVLTQWIINHDTKLCLNNLGVHRLPIALSICLIFTWASTVIVVCFNKSFLLMNQGYREDDGLILESDADEQLLIYIPFTQVIKLHSIVVKGTEEEGNCNSLKILTLWWKAMKKRNWEEKVAHLGLNNCAGFVLAYASTSGQLLMWYLNFMFDYSCWKSQR